MRVLGIVIVCLLLSAQLGAEDSSVPWLESLEQAKEQALSENKMILVDFWADWCAPCVQMEKFVWTDVEVGLHAEKFVPLKLDFDKRFQMARRYGVVSIPSLLFLDGYGNLMFAYRGGRSAEQVIRILRAMPKEIDDLHRQIEAVEASPNDLQSRLALADLYLEYGALGTANSHLRTATESDALKADPALLDQVRTTIAVNYLELGDFAKARKQLEKHVERYTQSALRPVQLSALARSYAGLGKAKKAEERLAMLEAEYPEHPATATARDELRQ